MEATNKPWRLESFVDALVVELDKTRETLALKSVNKSLSYTVRDMQLDLQIFPSYDGEGVRFVTASPGQEGASTINIKLDSITDQVIRATTKRLPTKNDISLEEIDIDPDTKKELRRIGVTSVSDIEEMDRRDIDFEKIGSEKINYGELANVINKARRGNRPPKIRQVTLSRNQGKNVITLTGDNLAVDQKFPPVAVLNDVAVEVVSFDDFKVEINIGDHALETRNELVVALDPYSVFKINVEDTQ